MWYVCVCVYKIIILFIFQTTTNMANTITLQSGLINSQRHDQNINSQSLISFSPSVQDASGIVGAFSVFLVGRSRRAAVLKGRCGAGGPVLTVGAQHVLPWNELALRPVPAHQERVHPRPRAAPSVYISHWPEHVRPNPHQITHRHTYHQQNCQVPLDRHIATCFPTNDCWISNLLFTIVMFTVRVACSLFFRNCNWHVSDCTVGYLAIVTLRAELVTRIQTKY